MLIFMLKMELLGASWRALGVLLRAKLRPSWTQFGPSWGQVGNLAEDGRLGGLLGGNLAEDGRLGGLLEASWGPLGSLLGASWAFLGGKMRPRWHLGGNLEATWPKMAKKMKLRCLKIGEEAENV